MHRSLIERFSNCQCSNKCGQNERKSPIKFRSLLLNHVYMYAFPNHLGKINDFSKIFWGLYPLVEKVSNKIIEIGFSMNYFLVHLFVSIWKN